MSGEALQAKCGACDFYREGLGALGVARVQKAAQKHVDRTGHPVELRHTTRVHVDLNRARP